MNKIIYSTQNTRPKIFSIRQVMVATGMVGVLAGSILIGLNYKRQEEKLKYWLCCGIGFTSLISMTLLILSVPKFPPMVFPIATIFFAEKWYKNSHYSYFKEHIRNGGEIEENRIVVGVSLLALLISLAIVWLMAALLTSYFAL